MDTVGGQSQPSSSRSSDSGSSRRQWHRWVKAKAAKAAGCCQRSQHSGKPVRAAAEGAAFWGPARRAAGHLRRGERVAGSHSCHCYVSVNEVWASNMCSSGQSAPTQRSQATWLAAIIRLTLWCRRLGLARAPSWLRCSASSSRSSAVQAQRAPQTLGPWCMDASRIAARSPGLSPDQSGCVMAGLGALPACDDSALKQLSRHMLLTARLSGSSCAIHSLDSLLLCCVCSFGCNLK